MPTLRGMVRDRESGEHDGMSSYRRCRLAGATYFFTHVLQDRWHGLLVDHIDLLRNAYARVVRSHPVDTTAICILPDHVHAIWQMPEGDSDYPLRWRLIKWHFSRNLPFECALRSSQMRKREKGVWQRRFWEHRIRTEADLRRHVDYVHFNPVKHGFVDKVADWPHSSFRQHVQRGWLSPDWGLSESPAISSNAE